MTTKDAILECGKQYESLYLYEENMKIEICGGYQQLRNEA